MDMKRKIISMMLFLAIVFGMGVNVCAESLFDPVEEPVIGGKYILCVTVDGVDYYYRRTTSSESVTDTTPYSLYTTNDPDNDCIMEFTLTALDTGFYLGYQKGESIHKIYSYDANGDGMIDTGVNGGEDVAKHCFWWDGTNGYIFTIKNNEKYVLAVQSVKNNVSGAEELHMFSVPAADLEKNDAIYPVRFVEKHVCSFDETWVANEYSHWHTCSCGNTAAMQLHQVDEWVVTKEAAIGTAGSRTGMCTVCGETAIEEIPALKKPETTTPNEDDQSNENMNENEQGMTLENAVTLVIAIALVAFGVATMILGNRKKHSKR